MTKKVKYHAFLLTGLSKVEPFDHLTLSQLGPRELNKSARFLWEYKCFDLLASYTGLPDREPKREILPNRAMVTPFKTKPGTSTVSNFLQFKHFDQ